MCPRSLGPALTFCGAQARSLNFLETTTTDTCRLDTMLSTSMNRATTENGEPYNKLKRPDDFLTPNASSAHHNGETTTSRSTEPAKRTREEADISDGEAEDEPNKRPRVQNGPIKFGRKSYRPQNTEIGMSSMFPGMLDEGDLSDDATNEALAYLRSVRYAIPFSFSPCAETLLAPLSKALR